MTTVLEDKGGKIKYLCSKFKCTASPIGNKALGSKCKSWSGNCVEETREQLIIELKKMKCTSIRF